MHALDFMLTNKERPNTPCKPPTAMVSLDAAGAFSAKLDISGCLGFFDGGDVDYSVTVDNVSLAGANPVTAVPYAKYADRVGTPECPPGYHRDASTPGIVLCKDVKSDKDQVVRVGGGPEVFWIDRFEATLWDAPFGGGNVHADGLVPGFAANGLSQDRTTNLFASSVSGVMPTSNLTWFQAAIACRLAGKHLPTGEEWLIAADHTYDPIVANDGSVNGECVTKAAGRRVTGGASKPAQTSCISDWGAEDMIGNVAEWTADWFAGPPTTNGSAVPRPWPANYGGDQTLGVDSFGYDSSTPGQVPGLPVTAVRGSWIGQGTAAGIFALDAATAPSTAVDIIGFRCAIR